MAIPPIPGALIEYGSDFLGPIPNVLLFQFNPDGLSRTLQIPDRPTHNSQRERNQVGSETYETIQLTAKFSAADRLGEQNILTRVVGIGPELAALEMMVRPVSDGLSSLIDMGVDAIAGALGGDDEATQSVPRKAFPRLLFIWGPLRVLPVQITAMTINEKAYDFFLNPIEAEVTMTLAVAKPDPRDGDSVGEGALKYSDIAKETLAVTNLANTISKIIEYIPF